jgi:cytochrome c
MSLTSRPAVAVIAAGAVALLLSTSASAFDAAAAEELARDNDCFKCHAVAKTKKGPAYKKIAAKYKGKEAEGEKNIIKNITTGPTVKLEDGTEQEHKIIDTKDPAKLKNLIAWILSQ